jgi:predicted PhzF superfamily epimerase YddE/YHI9
LSNSRLSYFVVDAFTNRPFAGNPAAIVPLDSWREDGWLQNVAMEMNLSETSYLVPNSKGFDLRWFTPKIEVDLCGHATLAAAKALAHMGRLIDGSEVAFSTRSGVLRAFRKGHVFQLDFPIKPQEKTEPAPGLVECLDVRPIHVGRNQFDYLLEVESETALRSLNPDFKRLAHVKCRGVIVTARSDAPACDFVSRFFAPAVGVDEDPVTGSAHCCLAEYWSKKLDKTDMTGYQASLRGGIVRVAVRGDRVLLGGEAVIVAEGSLLID